jgi:hypothetical protein
MNFVINVKGPNVAIAVGYLNTYIFTTKGLYHFWLNSNIFVYMIVS